MTTRPRARRPSARRTSRKKRTVWENLFIEHPHGTIGEEVFTDFTPEPMGSDLVGSAKILRMIMNFTWSKDATAINSTIQTIGFGISVMTNDAFAAGALPDPLSDFQQSWYYWTAFAGVFNTNFNVYERSADIRTQRVLRQGFKLVGVSQSLAANDLDTSFRITMRNLWEID